MLNSNTIDKLLNSKIVKKLLISIDKEGPIEKALTKQLRKIVKEKSTNTDKIPIKQLSQKK